MASPTAGHPDLSFWGRSLVWNSKTLGPGLVVGSWWSAGLPEGGHGQTLRDRASLQRHLNQKPAEDHRLGGVNCRRTTRTLCGAGREVGVEPEAPPRTRPPAQNPSLGRRVQRDQGQFLPRALDTLGPGATPSGAGEVTIATFTLCQAHFFRDLRAKSPD